VENRGGTELLDEWDTALESEALADDELFLNALEEAEADLAAGRVRPYEDVRRELDLG